MKHNLFYLIAAAFAFVGCVKVPEPAHEYYTVQVMRNTTTSNASSDASCMKQRLDVKDIKTYQPEYILRTETNSTAIGIIMQYEY